MEYPFRYENPFNVEAEWILHLRALNKKAFYNTPKYRKTLSQPENLNAEVEKLIQSLPSLHDSNSLIDEGLPPDEKNAILRWPYYNNFCFMLQFLSRYTEILACDKIFTSIYFRCLTQTEDGSSQEFESLNTNVEETGLLILPKVKTINDPLDPAGEDDPIDLLSTESSQLKTPKQWATDRFPGIQSELAGSFYVEVKNLLYMNKPFRVLNSVLKRNIFPEGKDSLRIAVAPVAHADLLEVQYHMGVNPGAHNLFCIKGLKDTDFTHNRIRAAFLQASRERADFLVFPEALGDEITHDRDFFYKIQNEAFAQGYAMPSLILMPTWWHQNQNELLVLDGSGVRLCLQQKQMPYAAEKNKVSYLEDLQGTKPVIHVVHIPGVGRLTFPICRDLVEEGISFPYIELMLRQLYSTFLLCPSYSPNKTQFNLVAHSLSKYGCYAVWGNTCAAYHERQVPEHIGFVIGPGGNMEVLSPQCDGNCGDSDTPCLFLIDVNMDRSSTFRSIRHIHEK